MGFIVKDYCHSTLAEARLHLASDTRSSPPQALSSSSSDAYFFVSTGDEGVAGSNQFAARMIANSSSFAARAFLSCDVSYEGGYMPWSPHYDSGAWSGVYTLEFVGSLIGATFLVWGMAFLGRSAWRIFA